MSAKLAKMFVAELRPSPWWVGRPAIPRARPAGTVAGSRVLVCTDWGGLPARPLALGVGDRPQVGGRSCNKDVAQRGPLPGRPIASNAEQWRPYLVGIGPRAARLHTLQP